MKPTPTQIEKHSPRQIRIGWSSGDRFAVEFTDLRFQCPCAACVDEHTGERVIQRESISPEIRPLSVEPVGRYAVQLNWSDGHNSGIYHFDTLFRICESLGVRI